MKILCTSNVESIVHRVLQWQKTQNWSLKTWTTQSPPTDEKDQQENFRKIVIQSVEQNVNRHLKKLYDRDIQGTSENCPKIEKKLEKHGPKFYQSLQKK